MGSLKELGELFRDGKGLIKEMGVRANDIKGVSLARKSSAATLQFPVIMSRSINVDTASNVVKALERNYAVFVQLVVSLNPVIDWDKDDITSFIQKIHQNTPTPMDVIESCINVYSDETLGLQMIMSINEGCNGQVLRSNKEQMLIIEEHLNQNKLNDLFKPEQITLERANASLDYFMLTEAKHRPKKDNGHKTYKGMDGFAQAYDDLKKGQNPTMDDDDNEWGVPNDPNPDLDEQINAHNKKREENEEKRRAGGHKKFDPDEWTKNHGKKNKDNNHKEEPKGTESKKANNSSGMNDKKQSADPNKGAKANDKTQEPKGTQTKKANDKDPETVFKAEQDKNEEEIKRARFKAEIEKDNALNRSRTVVKLSDNDVKKCNELVPTTLTVTVQQMKKDNFGGNINFVIGVKGLMHPVNSDEMVSNLLDGYKAGNKFFNFLRWTSGEISFLKDLIFNVNEIKEDVIRKHDSGSHWWTTLKRNRTLARIKNIYGSKRILPNATIVCSMEEVLEIQDAYNVDLMDTRVVRKIMDRYFLIGFVIVDESQELCYFIFDGENDYQALSFKGLERENNNKNDFKDIYKMINSGRL